MARFMKSGAPMPSTKLRVLVVDDEAATRAALQGLLESQGYSVDQAANGAAALERLVELPPDVIVTDLDMPVMNGMQLLQALRERLAGKTPDYAALGLSAREQREFLAKFPV